MNSDLKTNKLIYFWLLTGFAMVLIQIILGGITRLTGSGLSITRWDIITGVMFPFNDTDWNYYFNLYKQTPQYKKINLDISLSNFKFIFFWEYIHRLWARMMGLVFFLPLLYFFCKGWIHKKLLKNIIIIFLLASLVASLGWIMVASGLVQRPWVNAYKLSFHLITAVTLAAFIFHCAMNINRIANVLINNSSRFLLILICLCFVQIFFGGIMSGMKAALASPTWPMIQGKFIPDQMFHLNAMKEYLFTEYELSHSGPLIIQFIHRTIAYLLLLLIILFCCLFFRKHSKENHKLVGLLCICFLQVLLGIWTLINSIGYIPLWPGVFHQLLGILLLIYLIWMIHVFNFDKNQTESLR